MPESFGIYSAFQRDAETRCLSLRVRVSLSESRGQLSLSILRDQVSRLGPNAIGSGGPASSRAARRAGGAKADAQRRRRVSRVVRVATPVWAMTSASRPA